MASDSLSEGLSRRTLLCGTIGAVTVGISPSLLSAQTRPAIVQSMLGVGFQKAYQKYVVGPFVKENGADVIYKLGKPSEWVTTAMLSRSKPELDILMLAYPDSIRAVVEDLGAELTPEAIPNLREMDSVWVDVYRRQGVALDYVSTGLGYRTDSNIPAPTSWLDLFKPEYKGRIALPNITTSGSIDLLLTMARLHGGSEDNIEPGIQALKRLAPSVRKFYVSPVECAQMLERGDVLIAAMNDSNAWRLKDGGKPVNFVSPKEGSMIGAFSLHIAKNTPHMALCQKLVNTAISAEANGALCSEVGVGATNKHAKLTGKAAERVLKLEQIIFPDWYKIVGQLPKWVERWSREITG